MSQGSIHFECNILTGVFCFVFLKRPKDYNIREGDPRSKTPKSDWVIYGWTLKGIFLTFSSLSLFQGHKCVWSLLRVFSEWYLSLSLPRQQCQMITISHRVVLWKSKKKGCSGSVLAHGNKQSSCHKQKIGNEPLIFWGKWTMFI